jgi:hypothetical protein
MSLSDSDVPTVTVKPGAQHKNFDKTSGRDDQPGRTQIFRRRVDAEERLACVFGVGGADGCDEPEEFLGDQRRRRETNSKVCENVGKNVTLQR